MADITYQEKQTIEKHFIQSGYVLDFSDRTFREFIIELIGLDINDPKFSEGNSGSKGNRLRSFIKLESDYNVGVVLKALRVHAEEMHTTREVTATKSYADIEKVYERLLSGGIVENLDAIQANNDDKDFNQLAKLIKESIENNEPEAALDRLHTFMQKYLKELCKTHNVEFGKEESVNAIYGKYIKAIREKGFIESDMAEKIIQSTFQVMQAFNDIRNNKSFAHDNPVLNYDESVLIFGYVTSTIKFIQKMEARHKNDIIKEAKADWGEF